MTPSTPILSRLRASLLRVLQALRTALREWLPQPAPVLRPIPLRIEHHPQRPRGPLR